MGEKVPRPLWDEGQRSRSPGLIDDEVYRPRASGRKEVGEAVRKVEGSLTLCRRTRIDRSPSARSETT